MKIIKLFREVCNFKTCCKAILVITALVQQKVKRSSFLLNKRNDDNIGLQRAAFALPNEHGAEAILRHNMAVH